MTLLTKKQITDLCIKVGFPTTGAVSPARIAGAIAMVESPTITGATSYTDSTRVGDQALANATWGYSYGHFQVRSLRADTGKATYRDANKLPDSEFNCQAALQIWKNAGNKFTPWSTFNTGQYKAYLQDIYPPAPGTYIVVSGDTLSKIATKVGQGYTWQDLARVNGIRSPYTIYIGQVILLPYMEYTVVAGDTLSKIATTYGEGITWERLAEFNNITNPNQISPGQIIRIPRQNL